MQLKNSHQIGCLENVVMVPSIRCTSFKIFTTIKLQCMTILVPSDVMILNCIEKYCDYSCSRAIKNWKLKVLGCVDTLEICFFVQRVYNYDSLRCRHANIVYVMGFCIKPPIIMYEYMDYALHDVLHKGVCSY